MSKSMKDKNCVQIKLDIPEIVSSSNGSYLVDHCITNLTQYCQNDTSTYVLPFEVFAELLEMQALKELYLNQTEGQKISALAELEYSVEVVVTQRFPSYLTVSLMKRLGATLPKNKSDFQNCSLTITIEPEQLFLLAALQELEAYNICSLEYPELLWDILDAADFSEEPLWEQLLYSAVHEYSARKLIKVGENS